MKSPEIKEHGTNMAASHLVAPGPIMAPGATPSPTLLQSEGLRLRVVVRRIDRQ